MNEFERDLEQRGPNAGFVHVEKTSIEFVRNAKGDTQIKVKVVAGESPEEVERIRSLALEAYRQSVEATGGLLPS